MIRLGPVDPRAVVADSSSTIVQQAEAVLLTDGTTRILGATCTPQTTPAVSNSSLLTAFRASLAGNSAAQATFDAVSALLP